MNEKRKLHLKKYYFHPITTFLLASIGIIILSAILSAFGLQATYNTVNNATGELEPHLITVNNLLSYNGLKNLISNATRNFAGFAPLSMLLLSLIGISVAEATGFVDAIAKRRVKKIPKYALTFIILFLGTISSLVNDVGYAILIPLAAVLYEINGRNPLLGIITAFCGVAFSSAVSIFVGYTEVNLIPATTTAAYLIDNTSHISLTSNLIFIIVSSIVIPFIGTFVVEKIIAPRLPKYHFHDRSTGLTLKTSELLLSDIEEEEASKLSKERNEKRGLRSARIVGIIILAIYAYMLIPGLPGSGLLLDTDENIYVNQLFGKNSYFHQSFTFLVMMMFVIVSLAYGLAAKTLTSDKDIIEKTSLRFKDIGMLIVLIFVFSGFIAIWKASNIGQIITALLANLLSYLKFTSIPLILVTIVVIAFAGIFVNSISSKWEVFAPVVVPSFMQANMSPAFAQIIMRVSDSITKGITPFMSFFVLYIGYLNLFNENKSKPYTVNNSIRLINPYFLIIGISWIILTILFYIAGIPVGPGVSPTI